MKQRRLVKTKLVTRFKDFVSLVDCRDVRIAGRTLAEYVAQYDLSIDPVMVFRNERHLVPEIPGQPYYWLIAESDTKLFLRTENTEIDFRVGANGRSSEMTIHNSNGSDRLHFAHHVPLTETLTEEYGSARSRDFPNATAMAIQTAEMNTPAHPTLEGSKPKPLVNGWNTDALVASPPR